MGRFAASVYSRDTSGSMAVRASVRKGKPWPDRMAPELFVSGRLTMRTSYPPEYTRGAQIGRPPYIYGSRDTVVEEMVHQHFPGLEPRSVFQGGWAGNVYGMAPARYFASLFNLEGVLLRGEWLEGDMLAAGVVMVLQDLVDEIWFPTASMLAQGITFPLTPKQEEATAGKKYLVFPTLVGGNHWVVCIFDQKSRVGYWFNTFPSCDDQEGRAALEAWLKANDVGEGVVEHKTVECLPQASGWECGLLVLENVRRFFREPSVRDRSGPYSWGDSRLVTVKLPGIGNLDSTLQKVSWLTMVYCGWIRSELGVYGFEPLREPADPVISWKTYTRGGKEQHLPNQVYTNKSPTAAAVAKYLKGDCRSRTPVEGQAITPTMVLSATEVGRRFDTWVSGELGLFMWAFLPPTGSYAYTRYRTGAREAPARYAVPLPIPRAGFVASDDGSEEERGSGDEEEEASEFFPDIDKEGSSSGDDDELPSNCGSSLADEVESSPYVLMDSPAVPSVQGKTPLVPPIETLIEKKDTAISSLSSNPAIASTEAIPEEKSKAVVLPLSLSPPSGPPVKLDLSPPLTGPAIASLLPPSKRKADDSSSPLIGPVTPKKPAKELNGHAIEGTQSKAESKKRGKRARKTGQQQPEGAKRVVKGQPKKKANALANTDKTSDRWITIQNKRGKMLGRRLFDHCRSPRGHLSPSHEPDWRGWEVEKTLWKQENGL
ncbi:hypothetical protein SEUCBS139899_010652 [Sporothrix eucalyptigena]